MAALSAVLPLALPPATPTRYGGRAAMASSGRRAMETDGETRSSDVPEGGLDGREAEAPEQAAELALGAGNTHEVAEPVHPRHRRPRLVHVELPPAAVQHHRL